MSKKVLEALEFEKSKREILKMSPVQNSDQTREFTRELDERSTQKSPDYGQKRYAWEIELENYRKSKWKERFFIFCAICGILALVMTLLFNFDQLQAFLMKFL